MAVRLKPFCLRWPDHMNTLLEKYCIANFSSMEFTKWPSTVLGSYLMFHGDLSCDNQAFAQHRENVHSWDQATRYQQIYTAPTTLDIVIYCSYFCIQIRRIGLLHNQTKNDQIDMKPQEYHSIAGGSLSYCRIWSSSI